MNTQIKARPEFKQGNLDVKFGQSKFFKTSAMNGKTDVDFFLCNFKFFLPDFKFVSKSDGRFTKPPSS
jgi:hypothetical protein